MHLHIHMHSEVIHLLHPIGREGCGACRTTATGRNTCCTELNGSILHPALRMILMTGEEIPITPLQFKHVLQTISRTLLSFLKISFLSPCGPTVTCLSASVPTAQWQHLKGNSFQPRTQEMDSPANYHHPQRRRGPNDTDGGEETKETKMETLLTFVIRVWLRSCLPSGVRAGVTCWQTENVFLSFSSLFILCVTPFVSSDRFLVTVDDLWMALSWVWNILGLFISYHSLSAFLFLFHHLWSSSLSLSLSLSIPTTHFVSLSLFSLSCLHQFIPVSLLCHISIRPLSAVHVRVRRTVRLIRGVQRINLSLSLSLSLTHTHTDTHTHTHTHIVSEWGHYRNGAFSCNWGVTWH